MLTLVDGSARCELYPNIGGSIGSWSIDGQDMLRRADCRAIADRDPLGMASFPLVPYSNRIGNSQFAWQGETIRLRSNFAPESHALHGVGWRRAWHVDNINSSAATLTMVHAGDADWPWPFRAEQRLTLTADRLHLRLTVDNLADIAVPGGFGHHPYFDADGATLVFASGRMWTNGDDNLPASCVAPDGRYDFAERAAVRGREVDNCYSAPTVPATIEWLGRPIALSIDQSSTLPCAVIYVPADDGFFCFEPVPHVNNALNMPSSPFPMPIIAPGGRFTAEITFSARSRQASGGPSESR